MRKELMMSMILIMVTVSFVFGCTENGTAPTATPTATPDITATPAVTDTPMTNETPDQAEVFEVSIRSFAFNPASVSISVGDTVRWTNEDTAGHTIKFGEVTSPVLSRGQSFQYTFDQAGTVNYICSIHPAMKGMVIVQ